ncbi:MAG: 50S ribosomal protein L30 [Legionellales bacterium]|nr:50S ribosomal protein L30 [Legionellales bacterium]
MNKTVNIKLVKSLIGRVPKHKEIAKLLGLTKMNTVVVKPNNPAIMGMINTINYLVEWREAE